MLAALIMALGLDPSLGFAPLRDGGTSSRVRRTTPANEDALTT
jgi:hypothetical protein